MRRFAPALLVLAMFMFAHAPARAADRVFKAGAHAADITPEHWPISVNGGMRDRQADGAHDPLHARCLVIDDGDTRIAFAVCDSCMIPRDVFDEAKQIASEATGIPTDHMLFSATHTHSAPTSTGVFQSDPDERYRKLLVQRIAEGVIKANAQREPARIGWAVGLDPTQVFNRRWLMRPGKTQPDPFGGDGDRVKMNPGFGRKDLARPAAPVDPEVAILAVKSVADDEPIALLANYSLHYVGRTPGGKVSADYFGEFARRMTVKLEAGDAEPAFVGIMSNGTSGDINNVDFSALSYGLKEPFAQIEHVAESVARAAHLAYSRVEYHDWVDLAMAEAEIELGVRKPTTDEIARAKKILDEAYERGPVLRSLGEVYARETVKLSEYPDTVKLKLQALRVGELGVCAIPCEVFVEIGLALKEDSPLLPTFTIELANGYNGYLPTPEQHELRGYETWRARSSYLEEQASPKVVDTLMRLLGEVAESRAAAE